LPSGNESVTHLADHDHIGVVAQRVAQGGLERRRVGADLSLGDGALGVGEEELDGILDRHDVHETGIGDHPHQRRQRRRLAGAGRAGDENQSLRQVYHLAQHRRQAPVVEGREIERHPAEDRGSCPALLEDGRAEPGDPRYAVAEVHRLVLFQVLLEVIVEDRVRELRDQIRRNRIELQR
jgi:hypothetical protein